MSNEESNTRSLVLSGDVTEKAIGKLVQRMVDINEEDDNIRATLKEGKYKERPIKLFINTDGGTVHDALALIGAIELSETPVYTITLGRALSAGLLITVAGDLRFAHRLTTFMYHEVYDWNIGKLESQKRKLEEAEKLMDMLDSFLLEKTNIDKEKLEKGNLSDWYFNADEALEMGVVDYILMPGETIETDDDTEGEE